MRLAIISDVHGNVRALEAVLADIRSRGVDATVNLGDCVTGPTWPRESFECLATLNVPTVRGNHDRWIVDRPTDGLPPAGRFAREALTQEQRNALFALPATLELEGGILATHGTPTDDSTYLTEETYDYRMIPAGRDLVRERLGEAISRKIVLCGHSHRQSVTQVPGGPLIVNPGSVGCPVFADIPTAPRWELHSPHARYAILTQAGGNARVEMLALEYDWAEAAEKALANGFPKWAESLLTGAVG
jgi:predicted phosphodiesterase